MSFVELLDAGERVGRKDHQCFDCYRPIRKGCLHSFSVCKYEGSVYTIRSHSDCYKANDFYRKFHGLRDFDFDIDGIPPLADMISDAGEYEVDHAMLRGYYPHVVCRLELSDQNRG
ncbi:MAG: hypothetical protein GY820_41850 [Gammaproteobacteria bacterium]|nr:hypothetical protein [Gammaproteobacteria bacterium]